MLSRFDICVRTRLTVKFITFLAITTLMSFNSSPATTGADIAHMLDRIDSRIFVEGIVGPCSGDVSAIVGCALYTEEIQYLLSHRAEAIPKMLQRMNAPGGIHYAPARIAYFIVFKESNDARVLPALADFLDSISMNEQSRYLISSDHDVLNYALVAAGAYVDLHPFFPTHSVSASVEYLSAQAFEARHKVADALRAEYHRRTKMGFSPQSIGGSDDPCAANVPLCTTR